MRKDSKYFKVRSREPLAYSARGFSLYQDKYPLHINRKHSEPCSGTCRASSDTDIETCCVTSTKVSFSDADAYIAGRPAKAYNVKQFKGILP